MSLPGALHTGLLTWVLIKADTVMRLFARMLALIDDGAGTVEVAQSLAVFIVLVAGMCAVYAVLATSGSLNLCAKDSCSKVSQFCYQHSAKRHVPS